MTDERLVELSDQSYFDWSRSWTQAVGGEVRDMDGVLLTITGAPQEWWNVAFVTRPLDGADEKLRGMIDEFERRAQPFIVRLRAGLDEAAERALQALGFVYTDTMPGMVLTPIAPPPEAPAALDVRLVEDERDIAGCVRVLSESYEMDPEVTRMLFPPRLIDQPGWQVYLGHAEGEPAAAAAVAQTDGVAGITFVGTRPAFRKRGFGESVTWRAVYGGAARGCDLAALQASEMGYPIYERMGFRHVTGYKTYVLPKYRS